jgi:hypothetical protein
MHANVPRARRASQGGARPVGGAAAGARPDRGYNPRRGGRRPRADRTMTIVVLEHLSSAPRAPGARRAALEREGRAMRDAVAADLAALPGVEVVVLDRAAVPPGWSRDAVFRDLLRRADAALVIAPEEDGLLERLTRLVEDAGRLLLGPGPTAVGLAADKAATARLLRAAGLPAPRTRLLPFTGARAALARRRPPFILKPRDGCGCAGVVAVRRRDAVRAALAAVRKATTRRAFLWQEEVEGIDASVAVLAAPPGAPRRFLPIGPCRQRVRRRLLFTYRGGDAPLAHPLSAEARDVAARAVAALDAAAGGAVRGWVGVDLVIGAGAVRVIEINPRLTTSYVGLRRLVRPALAGLLLRAAAGGAPPERVTIQGACRFDADGRTWISAGPAAAGSWRSGLRSGRAAWRTAAGTSAAST